MTYEETENNKRMVESSYEDRYYKFQSYLHDEACRMVREELEEKIRNE